MGTQNIQERCDQLFNHLDMKMKSNDGVISYQGKYDWNKDFYVHYVEIAYCSKRKWEKLFTNLKAEYDKRVNGRKHVNRKV